MADRDGRLRANQRTFRAANERINDLAQVTDGQLVPFLCECADIACLGRIEASLSEFVVIHEDRTRFFVLPGHLRVNGEEIVSASDPYEIVEKQAA
ncbi:MAG: hypothetical protein ACRDM2_07990 [Gaiellaceae bacterium]